MPHLSECRSYSRTCDCINFDLKHQTDKGGGYLEVSLIFKIAAVGILVSVISQILKHSGREEQAFLTSLAGLLLVVVLDCAVLFKRFI